MKLPAVAAVPPARATGAVEVAGALVNAGCCGDCAGSATGGSAGGMVEKPSRAAKARATIDTLPAFSPALRARTVIVPGVRVARIATRLIPASRSRNGWLIESILPLL